MTVLYEDHPAMFRNNPLGFLLAVLLVPVGIGIVILVVWHLKSKASRLQVTEDEVLYEKGLLSKERSEIAISSVRTVRVSQSFLNRLFGTGTVELYTAGDNPEIVAVGMPNPNRVRELVKLSKDS